MPPPEPDDADSRLARTIAEDLASDDRFRRQPVAVQVQNGVAILTGTVESPEVYDEITSPRPEPAILRQDDISPTVQMGRRHRPNQGPHDRPGVGLLVPPPSDQMMQSVDVEVQGARVPVEVKRRQSRLADARRPVQMDKSCHSNTIVGPITSAATLPRSGPRTLARRVGGVSRLRAGSHGGSPAALHRGRLRSATIAVRVARSRSRPLVLRRTPDRVTRTAAACSRRRCSGRGVRPTRHAHQDVTIPVPADSDAAAGIQVTTTGITTADVTGTAKLAARQLAVTTAPHAFCDRSLLRSVPRQNLRAARADPSTRPRQPAQTRRRKTRWKPCAPGNDACRTSSTGRWPRRHRQRQAREDTRGRL